MSQPRATADEAVFSVARSGAQCITCRRPIDCVSRRSVENAARVPVLPESDFCAFCGLAISARAVALEEAFARPTRRELVVNVDTRGVGAR